MKRSDVWIFVGVGSFAVLTMLLNGMATTNDNERTILLSGAAGITCALIALIYLLTANQEGSIK